MTDPDSPAPYRVPMDRVLALVVKSRAEQGLGPKLVDPVAISEIAPLFAAGTADAVAIASRRT